MYSLINSLFVIITLALFTPPVYAVESCDEVLGVEQHTPQFLKELRKLKRDVLNSSERASRLLIEKTFNNKLSEAVKTLKISEKELSNLLDAGSDASLLSIVKKQEKVETIPKTNSTYQVIAESFQKYESYPTIKERARAYFKKIFIDKKSQEYPEVRFNPENPSSPILNISSTFTDTYSAHSIRAAFLMEALQDEFAKETGIKLEGPIGFNFKETCVPLSLAMEFEDRILTRAAYLLEAKTQIDPSDLYSNMTPLAYYLHIQVNPKKEFIEFLIDEFDADIFAKDEMSENLIHVLMRVPLDPEGTATPRDDKNTIQILNYFYQHGPQLFSMKTSYGTIPMHTTEITPEVLKWMINKGFDINNQDYTMGGTLLMSLVENNILENAKILLKANADKTIKDKNGKTALDYARENNFTDLIELLK